jgi:hypothetical protein
MESPSVKEFRLDPVWSLTSSGLSSFVLAVGDARSAIRVACSGGNKKVGHRRHRRGARPHFWRILPNFSRLPAISVADATAKGDGGTLEGHDDTSGERFEGRGIPRGHSTVFLACNAALCSNERMRYLRRLFAIFFWKRPVQTQLELPLWTTKRR